MSPQRPVPRLAKLVPASLDEEQRAVYDAIAGGRRAQGPRAFQLVDEEGGLEGPFNAFLLRPRVGGPLLAVAAAVRHELSLTDRAREIAILIVAAQWDSDFERYAHEAVGRAAGVTEEELAGLRAGTYDALSGDEAVIARTTALLAGPGDLDQAQYDAAVAVLGVAGVFELLTLVGHYAMLALQMRVFRVATPEA